MPDPHPGSSATSVTVRNDRAQAVEVFAERGVFDTRLGKVPAGKTATLRIPDWLANREGVSLLVQPEGGFDLQSRDLRIPKGDHLGVVVPAF